MGKSSDGDNMLGIDMNPAQTLELSVEAEIKEQEKELSDLPDGELTELVVQARKKYEKWEGGDPACAWIRVAYQPEEVYRGMAAGRILADRHGKDYVKDLLNSLHL